MSCGLPWAPGLEEVNLISALPSCCLERPQIPESSPEGQHANHLAPALGLRGKKLVYKTAAADQKSCVAQYCAPAVSHLCLPSARLWLRCTRLHSQSKFFPAQLSLRTLPQISHLVLFMQGELSHHKSYVSLFGVNIEKDCS